MEINKVSDDHNNAKQPQPKKQTRKRLHTTKSYQESFVNMAEARREIATALKFHRASMKQQQAASHHTLVPPPPPPPPPPISLHDHQQDFNWVLPNQTLGLNLNFNDFNNFNTSIYYNPMPGEEATVVKAARWWCKTNEIGAVEDGKIAVDSHEDDDWCHHPFEQVMEFPTWLVNANETSCSQHMFDHQLSHEYSPDPALPCMEIDDIEGMDGEEWLAEKD